MVIRYDEATDLGSIYNLRSFSIKNSLFIFIIHHEEYFTRTLREKVSLYFFQLLCYVKYKYSYSSGFCLSLYLATFIFLFRTSKIDKIFHFKDLSLMMKFDTQASRKNLLSHVSNLLQVSEIYCSCKPLGNNVFTERLYWRIHFW